MLNENGFLRPTHDEILATKIQKAKELFGDDIETSEQTPLGKFIRINAYDLALAWEDLEMVYYARFPNTASGVSLDRLCVFAGIARNQASYAEHTIKVYGSAGSVIGACELIVSAENEVSFYNVNQETIPEGGVATIVVRCEQSGVIGNVEEITTITNPISSVDRIEYIGIKEPGQEAESDFELRKRFSSAVEGAGSANVNAIRAALMRIPTVISVGVIANETNEPDEKGRPGRSFECFIYGGEDQEELIARTIFEKAPIGIKTCSTSDEPVSVEVIDDGGYSHTIYFSYCNFVNVHLKFTVKKDARFEADGVSQIKEVLIDHINHLGMSADIALSSLYGYIYSVAGVVDVTNLQISTNGTTWTNSNVTVEDWEVPSVVAENINIEVIS